MILDDPRHLLTDRPLLLRRSRRERPIEIVIHSFDLQRCHARLPIRIQSECRASFMNWQPYFMKISRVVVKTDAPLTVRGVRKVLLFSTFPRVVRHIDPLCR